MNLRLVEQGYFEALVQQLLQLPEPFHIGQEVNVVPVRVRVLGIEPNGGQVVILGGFVVVELSAVKPAERVVCLGVVGFFRKNVFEQVLGFQEVSVLDG